MTNINNAQRFRTRIGDEELEIIVEDDRVLVNGAERTVSFEEVSPGRFSLLLDGKSHVVTLESEESDSLGLVIDGHHLDVQVRDERTMLMDELARSQPVKEGAQEIRAPMPGLVVRILVKEGDEVVAGDGVIVLEAMKMENELKADAPGRIKTIHVAPEEAVTKNALLMEFEANGVR